MTILYYTLYITQYNILLYHIIYTT